MWLNILTKVNKLNQVFQNISLANKLVIDDVLISLSKVIKIEEYSFEGRKNSFWHNGDLADNSQIESQSVGENVFLTIANSQANAIAIGTEIIDKIALGRDNDTILGVANASAVSESIAIALAVILGNELPAKAESEAIAVADALAIGIDNLGKIITGNGNDTLIGVANASAAASAKTVSQAEAIFGNKSSATANSKSIASANILAIGIGNIGEIATGKGNDMIIGVANTWADSQAEATALASNIAAGSTDCDFEVVNQIETAISSSTSATITNSKTSTFGIFNSGQIHTGQGDDLIFGVANTRILSNSQAIANAESVARDLAIAAADAESMAIGESDTVGIVNTGAIATGRGNDMIIGIAVNNATAMADASANAVSIADDSNSQTDTNSIADTSRAIAIGIDNTSGVIETSEGDDQIIGYGVVGIKGGNIDTGKGNDRIIAYGSNIGVEDSEIKLGQGNDYFQAAIVDFNPFTREVDFPEDQSGSIKNAAVFGDRGNDTFEIGGFAGIVAIDGGRDYDVLKLWGNIDDYKISLGSSRNQALTIEDADSMLIVENIEAFYFGNSDRVYSFNDFA